MIIYRLAVLADIHGNLPAFEAVIEALKSDEPLDGILVAGDILGGPGQRVILQKLLDMKAVMIQGNGEQRVIKILTGTAPDYYYTSLQFSLPRWVGEHLTDAQRGFLQTLPEQRVFQLPGSDPIRMVHGSPRKVDELVLPSRNCHPNLYYEPVMLHEVIDPSLEPVIIFGHTHLSWVAHIDEKLAFNPGAVNFPENDYIGAQYALLEWDGVQWKPSFHQVPYDLERLKRDYQESGLLSASPLARVMLQSVLTGRDFLPVYFQHVRQVANKAGSTKSTYFADDVWEQAERTFPWMI